MASLGDLPADLMLHIAGMCPDALTLHELRGTNSALRKVVQGMEFPTLTFRTVDLGKLHAPRHWTRIIGECGGFDAFTSINRVGTCPVVRFSVDTSYKEQKWFLLRYPRALYARLTINDDVLTRPLRAYYAVRLEIRKRDIPQFGAVPIASEVYLPLCTVHIFFLLDLCNMGTTTVCLDECTVTNGSIWCKFDKFRLVRRGKEWSAYASNSMCEHHMVLLAPLFAMCDIVYISGTRSLFNVWRAVPHVHTIYVENSYFLMDDVSPDLQRVVVKGSAFMPPDMSEWNMSDPTSQDRIGIHIPIYTDCTFTRKQ